MVQYRLLTIERIDLVYEVIVTVLYSLKVFKLSLQPSIFISGYLQLVLTGTVLPLLFGYKVVDLIELLLQVSLLRSFLVDLLVELLYDISAPQQKLVTRYCTFASHFCVLDVRVITCINQRVKLYVINETAHRLTTVVRFFIVRVVCPRVQSHHQFLTERTCRLIAG